MPKWNTAKVVKIEDASPTTKRFWLKPDEGPIPFLAGQFITMDLPIGDKRLDRWRSYSIANAPGEGLIELCIVHLEGGLASGYFFEEVELGTEIRFKDPDGNFVLPEDKLDRELVFICTGTGIAPFRSMLLDIDRRGLAFHKIHLIFGTRFEDGILYREEMEALAQKHAGFRYSIALSRQTEGLPPNASKGYVHTIYQEAYPEKSRDLMFYLCGWTGMIDEAVVHLVAEMGYDRSQVLYELYG